MKIALCFYGLNRALSKTFSSIQSSLYDPLDALDIEYDIYATLMHPKNGFSNVRSQELNCYSEVDSLQLLGAKRLTCLDQDDFDQKIDYESYRLNEGNDPYQDGHASSKNIFRALFSMRHVYLQAKDAADYDFFLFLRPDLYYHDPIDFKNYLFGERPTDKLLLTPSWGQWGGLNDRMAICGKYAAEVYAKRFDNIRFFLEVVREPLNSERFLLFAAIFGNANYKKYMHERAGRVRANGAFVKEVYAHQQLRVEVEGKYEEIAAKVWSQYP